MKSLRFLLVVVLCTVQIRSAQAQNRGFLVIGNGKNSCATWLSLRKDHKDEIRFADIVGSEAWLEGFISGHNAYAADTHQVAVADAEAIFALTDKICSEHPEISLTYAAITIIMRLGGIRGPPQQ